MINKLLKRYMPWQQRGRWIRVYFDGLEASDVNEISFRCPDNLTVTVRDEWSLNYKFNRPTSIITTRNTFTHVDSNNVDSNTNIVYNETSPNQMLGAKGYMDYYICDVEVI